MEAMFGRDILKKLMEMGFLPQNTRRATIWLDPDEFVRVDVETFQEENDEVIKQFTGYVVKEL